MPKPKWPVDKIKWIHSESMYLFMSQRRYKGRNGNNKFGEDLRNKGMKCTKQPFHNRMNN